MVIQSLSIDRFFFLLIVRKTLATSRDVEKQNFKDVISYYLLKCN